MSVLIKKDKKTGKKYRINIPDWDYPMPVQNSIAPNGMGMDLNISSHAASPVLSYNLPSTTYTWIFSFFNPNNWLLQTSADSGSTWTTNTTITGSISSSVKSITNKWVTIIGVDSNGNPITGRSGVIYT
jgi:hypothetical protein